MNKFMIGHNGFNEPYGYCLSELENINCDLDELLGMKFKTTCYNRYLNSDGKTKELLTEVTRPDVGIYRYNMPKNYINSLSWKRVTKEFLKNMPTYLEIEYNGSKIYVGVFLKMEDIQKMTDYKSYTTHYDFGPLSTNGGISFAPFEINN